MTLGSSVFHRNRWFRLSAAARISGLYFILASLWLVGSDSLLVSFIHEPANFIYLSEIKGAFFVLATSVGLFYLVRVSFRAEKTARKLAVEQNRLLEMVATNSEIGSVLDSMVCLIESQAPGIRCSVLRLEENRLRHTSAPNLPQEYCRAVDGLIIGPEAGACGTAAYLGQKVYCNDIETDPKWVAFRDAALPAGLRACWSTPLFTSDKKSVLGTFAIYSSESGLPTPQLESLFALASNLGTIALEQSEARSALLESHRDLEEKIAKRTEQLETVAMQAQAADRLKSAFLATMSHELRTPLNSIIGFTGLLLQELPGPLNIEQKKQLGMVKKSSRHLLSLINDILDISKIEAGQLETHRDRFSARDLLLSVHEELEPIATKKGLSFRIELSDEVQDIVSDERRFRQIVLNLVNNALKFTDNGEVVMKADVLSDFSLAITVRDTGCGIREEDHPKIFEAFSQVDAGLSRTHEGTGLGLAICKKLVELLEGTIGFESRWQRGSIFRVVLPPQALSIQIGDAA